MSQISALERRVIALAEKSGDPASLCDWVEYCPNAGKVAGHWRAKASTLRLAKELTPSPVILNVLRVALDRADWDYRATGFKDFEIEAAKAWVAATGSAQ